MKVITVHWLYVAAMFCHLIDSATYDKPFKTMETRTRPTKVRGTIAIHVAKEETKQELALTAHYFPTLHRPLGCIVGLVDIVDCLSFEQLTKRPKPAPKEFTFGFFGPAYYAYVLENPRLLAVPVKATGQLGFWNWEPVEVEASDAAK